MTNYIYKSRNNKYTVGIVKLFVDGLKAFVNPSSYSNVKPEPVSIFTVIVYSLIFAVIFILEYNFLLPDIPFIRSIIILVVTPVWLILAIKWVHFITKKESKLATDDKIGYVVLSGLTVPAFTAPFIVGLTVLLFDFLDFFAILLPLAYTAYSLFVIHNGFKLAIDSKTATMATLSFIAFNMILGLLISSSISLYYS